MRPSRLPSYSRCSRPAYCAIVPRQETGRVRNNVSRRGSSNPSPTYLPVAITTRPSSGGMAASRAPRAGPPLLTQPGAQDHDVTGTRRKRLLESIEVIVPLREDQRRTPGPDGFNDVIAD